MGIAERVFDEEFALEEARPAARQGGREAERAADTVETPSCSAALGARSIEEQVVPI